MIVIPFLQFETTLTIWLKSLMLMSPGTFLLLGGLVICWLSLKTLTAKLAFLGGGLLIASVVTYFVNKEDKKQKELQKSKKINITDNFIDVDSENIKMEEQELKLSRMFKK